MREIQEVDEVATTANELADAISNLIANSSLRGMIGREDRDDMFSIGRVATFSVVTTLPIYSWSYGETLLWQLIASVCGKCEIEIGRLATYFATDPERPYIDAVLDNLWRQ